MPDTFAGDKKTGQSILGPIERRFIDWAVPKVPAPIKSHHLTALTVAWSAGTVLFGWLATDDLIWLHGISAMVFGQWLTDSLDLVFAGAIVIAYSFLVTAEWLEFLFLLLLLITCATMAVSFLSFAATNQFQIAYYGIGPTEIRIGYIALNTFVWLVGTEIFSWGVPVIVALNALAFLVMAVQTSRNLWAIDYEANVDGAQR